MGFKGSKGVSSKNDKAVLKPGNKVAVTLSKIIVNNDGNMVFSFKGDLGTLEHLEFKIDENHPKYEEKYADNAIARIKHIACAILGAEAEAQIDAIESDTFEAWAAQIIEMVKASPNKKTGLTVKIVVKTSKKNGKQFAALPLFPNFISSEIRPLDWGIDPRYDSFEYTTDTPDIDSDARSTPISDDDDDDFEEGEDGDDDGDGF
jgi:hypothetical protein